MFLPVLGMVAAFALLGIVGVVTLVTVNRQTANTRWVEHTHIVIESVGTLSAHLADARRAKRAYLLTGDRSDLSPQAAAAAGARQTLQLLRTLTADNPWQQARLDRLELAVEAVLDNLGAWNATRAESRLTAVQAIAAIREGDIKMAVITPIVAELLVVERRLLIDRETVMEAGLARNRMIQLAGISLSLALLVLAFVGLRREMRRRLLSEATTRKLNEELEERVRARTAELESFSYSVAHDLRSPLRGLSGFSEILLDEYRDKLDADGVDALHEIRDNAHRMAVLIDALLSLSQLTRNERRSVPVDLTAIVRAVVATLERHAHREYLELIVAEGIAVVTDPVFARTLIENLVDNAWKFTSKVAKARIEFGTTELDGERTFFVRDNGAGFEMAHSAKLFVPFHRLHGAREFPGTGIGLSTAHRIVTRSGGRIWAEARVDEGATFYFTLSDRSQGATS